MNRAMICRTVFTLLTLSALALHSADAAAHSRGEGAKRWLQRLDQNGDGALSLSEALSAHRTRFAKLDSNDDNLISRSELAVVTRARSLDARWSKLDLNRDTRISLQEYEQFYSERFAALDLNRDQVLSIDELRAARKRSGRGA
jgi:hypothetical protein